MPKLNWGWKLSFSTSTIRIYGGNPAKTSISEIIKLMEKTNIEVTDKALDYIIKERVKAIKAFKAYKRKAKLHPSLLQENLGVNDGKDKQNKKTA